jgi:hypothetical protein
VSKGTGNVREIDLGDDFGDVVLKANGAQVTIGADGSLHGIPAAANDKAKSGAALQIPLRQSPSREGGQALGEHAFASGGGQVGDLDDGGVYVGLSATDGRPLHAALADLRDYKNFQEALAAAERLKLLHPTAHVPTPEELDRNLFENRKTGHLKGTFNTSGSNPGSVYRSSAPHGYGTAEVQWFDDGVQGLSDTGGWLPVRLVW